jgi:hypothetical protein
MSGRYKARVVLAIVVLASGAACGDEPSPSPPDAPANNSPPAPAAPVAASPPADAAPLGPRLGASLARVAEACDREPLGQDDAFDRAVRGAWSGQYTPADAAAAPTELDVSFEVTDGRLTGTMSEPRTFGPTGVARLDSELVGRVLATRQVVFMKTYTTPGVDHSVQYVGALSEDGTTIAGTWQLQASSGTFTLTRAPTPP